MSSNAVDSIESIQVRFTSLVCFCFIGTDDSRDEGILASTSTGIVTDTSWKCTTTLEVDWTSCFFNDAHWPNARTAGGPDNRPTDIASCASWIWARGSHGGTVYCRKRIKGNIFAAMLSSVSKLNRQQRSYRRDVTVCDCLWPLTKHKDGLR